MWQHSFDELGGSTTRMRVRTGAGAVSFRQLVDLWRRDTEFRAWFNSVLAGMKFEAFFWECPVVGARTLDREFECVVIDAAPLRQVRADPSSFTNQFKGKTTGVATFSNLSGDAMLVVPTPPASDPSRAGFPHLASFVRTASAPQRDAFWRAIGEAFATTVAKRSVWLSTAGLGVPWVHVRLDSTPKYYKHGAYRTETAGR